MKAMILLLSLLVASCDEPTKPATTKRIDLDELEKQQRDRGVELAAQYAAANPTSSRSSSANTDDDIETFLDQERRAESSRVAAENAAEEVSAAIRESSRQSEIRHREMMDAIEDARWPSQ